MKSADFDKDGNMDLAIASEGYPNNRIIIYNGQKGGTFKPGQIISYGDTAGAFPNTGNTFREFMIDDVDNDQNVDWCDHSITINIQVWNRALSFRLDRSRTVIVDIVYYDQRVDGRDHSIAVHVSWILIVVVRCRILDNVNPRRFRQDRSVTQGNGSQRYV